MTSSFDRGYLFLTGVQTNETVLLDSHLHLLPASPRPDPKEAIDLADSSEDAAVYLLSFPRVTGQLAVLANGPTQMDTLLWNAGWDVHLLSAVLGCQLGQNLAGCRKFEEVSEQGHVRVTNLHIFGWSATPYTLSSLDREWLEKNFALAGPLMGRSEFRDAVHSLATYYWHPHPRARLALLWSGIEGIFKIEHELSFRLSLSIAKFLKNNGNEARLLYSRVKALYRDRSKAVHGLDIKGDRQRLVGESAELLRLLIRRCIECGRLPDADDLMF